MLQVQMIKSHKIYGCLKTIKLRIKRKKIEGITRNCITEYPEPICLLPSVDSGLGRMADGDVRVCGSICSITGRYRQY